MLFIDNKYTKWYYLIIDRAKTREPSGYIEQHHIMPKSFGGSNKKENLVKLTAREHYICHLLLTKMVLGKNRAKMIYALSLMKPKVKYNAMLYEKLKIEGNKSRSQYMAERIVSGETREKMSTARKGKYLGKDNSFYGKTHTAETRAKITNGRDYSLITGGNHIKSKKVQVNGCNFNSISDAVKELGIAQSTIADVLKGRCKNSIKVWEAKYLPYFNYDGTCAESFASSSQYHQVM